MRAYVGYSTAVQYWLKNGMDETNRANVVSFRSLNDAAYTLRELTSLDLRLHGLEASMARGWPGSSRKRGKTKREVPQGEAIHVLVPKGADSNRIEGFDRHVWSTRIPENSFCESNVCANSTCGLLALCVIQVAGGRRSPPRSRAVDLRRATADILARSGRLLWGKEGASGS